MTFLSLFFSLLIISRSLLGILKKRRRGKMVQPLYVHPGPPPRRPNPSYSSLPELSRPFLIDPAHRSYKHQYSNIYFVRLVELRPVVETRAQERWKRVRGELALAELEQSESKREQASASESKARADGRESRWQEKQQPMIAGGSNGRAASRRTATDPLRQTSPPTPHPQPPALTAMLHRRDALSRDASEAKRARRHGTRRQWGLTSPFPAFIRGPT
jgi:hypothetical protein